MLNLQICTVIIMTEKKHKKKIIIIKKNPCDIRDMNPVYMGSKSTKKSTTLWRPMQFTDKNNQYMLKL